MKQIIKKLLREGLLREEDYRGRHTAPDSSGGYPMTNLEDCYGDDVYSYNCEKYFGTNQGFDNESCSVIRSTKDNPNAKVKIYRAVPDLNDGININTGDWVTINKKYAKLHGDSNLDGKYKIISKVVYAKQLYSECNSIHEWGYSEL